MLVPLTIEGFLERASNVYGERPAIVDEPGIPGTLGRLSYGEFWARAKGMARKLDAMELGVGARVAIVSPNAAKFLIAFFGVSGFDRVLVPVNYRLNANEVQHIVEHSGAEVVLIDPEFDAVFANVTAKHRIILDGVQDAELFAPCHAPFERDTADENALVSINYTSGTTALPKGVRLTHRNCWLNAVTFGWHLHIGEGDVYLHTLPSFHCNGWGLPYALTAMGCKQVIVRKIDGEEILARIEREGVTILAAAPIVVASILQAADARASRGQSVPGYGSVRIICAGAPPPQAVIEKVETLLGWELIQMYGLTETAPLVTLNRIPRSAAGHDARIRAEQLVAAGPPAIGVQLRLGEDGEIFTRSNNVFDGYWNDREETERALHDGWFATGDIGELRGASLWISDRKKDVIITGGENVSSIEVEDCIYQHPAVAEACIIGVPDERWGETILALVVLEPAASLTEEDLIAYCREKLAHYKCPRRVEFRDSLERTATGKLQKNRIRSKYWAGVNRNVS